MSKVIKVLISESSKQAQVTLSSGQTATLNIVDPRAKPQLIKDIENGELAEHIERYAADTPTDVANDYALASDWETIYQL
jgi:hypothetical protein